MLPPVLAELPFPPEAIIPIIIVVAQVWSWVKNSRNKEPKPVFDYEPTVFDPTDEEREEILRRQEQGKDYQPIDLDDDEPFVFAPEPSPKSEPAFVYAEHVVVPPVPASQQAPVVPIAKPHPAGNLQTASVRPRLSSQRRRLNKFLSSPAAARDAILISEVLGKPVSMRDSIN